MKRLRLIFIGSCLVALFGQLFAHEFYVSVSSVKFLPEEKRLQIKIRTFTNDLEDAIVNRGHERPDLDKNSEHDKIVELISDYVRTHFALNIDGEVAEIEFLERYYDADVTWSILQVSGVAAVKKVQVENKILMEMFDAQTNIVRFDVNDEKKFLNLTKKLPRDVVVFEE